MSKETAKKLIAELQTNEELKAKIAGLTDREEMVKKAVEAGYDVTAEEMIEAEKEYRSEMAKKADELSEDELEGAAGGGWWQSEYNAEGKEYNCAVCNLYKRDQVEHNDWCQKEHFCSENYYTDPEPPKKDDTMICGMTSVM